MTEQAKKDRVVLAQLTTGERFRVFEVTDYEVQTVQSNFETGLVAQKFAPHVLLISLLAGDIDATDICRNIRANEDLQTIKIIALANHLSDSESNALLQKGFDACVTDPTDVTAIVSRIEQATAIVY